jgi:hypothetical protein
VAKKKWVSPQPKKAQYHGFVAPVLYPQMLRKIADTLDALIAFEDEDPTNREGTYFVGMPNGLALPLYSEADVTLPGEDENDPYKDLQGWFMQYDAQCWVFIPYIKEIENPDG